MHSEQTHYRNLAVDGGILRFCRDTGMNQLWTAPQTKHCVQRVPRALMVAVSNVCNKQCSFCYRPMDAESSWEYSSLLALAHFASDWGVLEMSFGGGEPTLLPRFSELLAAIWHETKLCPNFTTNGSKITPEFMAGIAGVYGQIQLSIYDDDDYMSVIQTLVNCQARFGLNYLVTPQRVKSLEIDIEQFANAGVKDILLLSYKGNDSRLHLDPLDLMRFDESLVRLSHRLQKRVVLKVDSCWGGRLQKTPQLLYTGDCGANQAFLSIRSDKKVSSCSFHDTGVPFEYFTELPDIYATMRGQHLRASPGCARLPAYGLPMLKDIQPQAAPQPQQPKINLPAESTQVKTWQSLTSNHSGSFHLVANFSTPELASEVESELKAFLRSHYDEPSSDEDLSDAMIALSEVHGFEWPLDEEGWPESWNNDEIQVSRQEAQLLIYHSYCLGLSDLTPYLRTRGGSSEGDWGNPPATVLFRLAAGAAGRTAHQQLTEFQQRTKLVAPWEDNPEDYPEGYPEERADCFGWCDGTTGGFYGRFSDLSRLKAYLNGPGFDDYRVLLGFGELTTKLRTLSDSPLCLECQHPLTLIEADLSIPSDQAACHGCGAMFELVKLGHLSVISRIGKTDLVQILVPAEQTCRDLSPAFVHSTTSLFHWNGEACATPLRFIQSAIGLRDGTLVVSSYNQLFTSKDQGITWTEVEVASVSANAFIQTQNGDIFGVGYNTIHSTDCGQSWSTLPGPGQVRSVAAASDSLLYVITEQGEIRITEDAAQHWKSCTSPVNLLCILVLPNEFGIGHVHAIAAGESGRVLRSFDGEVWTAECNIGSGDIQALHIGNDGRLYAVNSAGELLISDSDGAAESWQVVPTGTIDGLYAVASTPSGDLLLAGEHGVAITLPGIDEPIKVR